MLINAMRVHTLFALFIHVTHFSFCTNVKINFREKEKEVLDQILGPGRYDARIRPSGVNGTGIQCTAHFSRAMVG